MNTDKVTGLNFRCRHKHLLAVIAQPYSTDIQRHASGQVIHRFLMGPFFKNLTNTKQKHNRTGCTDITSEHGDTDGCRIKDRYLDLTLKQCMNTLINILHRLYTCDHCSDWHRQKQFVAIVNNYFCYKFIPVLAIGLSSGILSVNIRNIHFLILKASQQSDDCRFLTCIADCRILCTLLNFG